jgi:curved DNA-binding protein CbpA
MKTLYDLLGALPDDDAESLRAAFRKAAKANHPDVNPGDPEAPQRFRRIVRANAILSDERQRAAYDRLLEVARRQQDLKPKRSVFSDAIRRLAADAIVSAIVSVVLIGGYLLLTPVDRHASAQVVEVSRREQAQVAAVRAAELSEARADQHDKLEDVEARMKLDVKPQPAKLDSIALTVGTGSARASTDAPPAHGFGTEDARYYRERGILAYRSGDLSLALVNFDLAIHLDPGFSDSYVDRGIVYHRMGNQKRAFSDIAEAKRIDDLNRNKAASGASAP